MIKTILVEDEPSGLYTLKKLLTDYCPEISVIAECDTAASALEKIKLLNPQLVFLDITLPDKNSFELLKDIAIIDFEIIFVTAYNNYTLQALHYSAVDYLLKPVDEDLLLAAVKRAEKRIKANEVNNNIGALLHNLQKPAQTADMKLCVPSLKGFQVVDLKDILYCEASSSYTNIHFTNKHVLCSAKTIHEYDELLSDAGFVRIHKSFLINLLHVKEYMKGEGGAVLLSNGMQVEVSRRKKEYFMGRMKEYYK
jgi:two-component system, LytTR family, response regulator